MPSTYKISKLEESVATYTATTDYLKTPGDAARLVHSIITDFEREHFCAVYLNTKSQPVALAVISIGSLNASLVHPREILRAAIGCAECGRRPAASIILAHNHPTDDCTPSREDIEFTNRMAKAGNLVGIELLDHVILSRDGKYKSLKEGGFF